MLGSIILDFIDSFIVNLEFAENADLNRRLSMLDFEAGSQNSYYSDWDQLCQEVPQRSILEPVLFNVFINDIFLFCSK